MNSLSDESSIVRMTPRGIAVTEDARAIAGARAAFRRENYLRIPRFIQTDLLAELRKYLRAAHFEPGEYVGVGSDLVSWNSPVAGALHLLMNDSRLSKLIERVSGCGLGRQFYRTPLSDGRAFRDGL